MADGNRDNVPNNGPELITQKVHVRLIFPRFDSPSVTNKTLLAFFSSQRNLRITAQILVV